MSSLASENVIIQEYSAEQAGELVGWVNVIEKEESELVIASVAYARISPEGAKYSYISREGEQLLHPDSIKGFDDSTELRVVARGKEVLETRSLTIPAYEGRYRLLSQKHSFGSSFYNEDGRPHDGGVWALSNENILGAIKQQLVNHKVGELYPVIYYNLAQAAKIDMLLADPSMHTQTDRALHGARSYEAKLAWVQAADKAMMTDLTIFGSTKPKDIPERFRVSRRNIATWETELRQQRADMTESDWYRPIGFRPNGRSWPYMDPEATDEEQAFGKELWALQQQDTGPARHELGRELKEVGERLINAGEITAHLAALATREVKVDPLLGAKLT